MKKIIIGLIIILFVLMIGSYFLLKKNQPTPPNNLIEPSPNPTEVAIQKGLYIVGTDPSNLATAVDPKNKILVTFSRVPDTNEVDVSFTPQVDFDTNYDGTSMILIPRTQLQDNTTYHLNITFKSSGNKKTYTFTTKKSAGSFAPDTKDQSVINQQNQYEIKNSPDVFVAGFTPLNETNFTLQSDYTMKPTGHYVFYVTLKGEQTTAKQSFTDWLKAQGLNDSQIKSLDIIYVQ